MLNVPQVFRKFLVIYPSIVDGTQEKEYFDDIHPMLDFINNLCVPYTVFSLYECLTWSTVKYDTNGHRAVVNKFFKE